MARPFSIHRVQRRLGKGLFWLYCSLSYIFLLAPIVVVIGTSFNGPTETVDASFDFPPKNLSFHWYTQIPRTQFEALGLSFALAAISAVGACLLGVPAALGLVRSNLPGKALIAAIFRAPLQIPSIVTGIAFLQLYYLVGDLTGLYWQGTLAGLALGHIFVATPYVVGTVTAILQRFDRRLEEAAVIHGATPWRAFRRVTLPVIMPGVYAGALYAFMVSFADVPISIFLTVPGFVTYPVEIFFALENDFDPSLMASASVVILVCLALLLVMQRVVGLEVLLRTGGGGGR
ncbi:MAG: ABC transporter permease subunit [Rhizobiales bacterium]|nr:ABC transporter permease subunit [Hyphomicrobiales bacterium]